MRKINLGPWTIHCEFQGTEKRIPPTFLQKTIEQTLLSIPKSVLKHKLADAESFSLSVSIVGTATMQKINRTYRGKDKPTDVLSFSRLEGTPCPWPEIGDLILCWPVCVKQARENGFSTREELRRLTVHGMLHLFGYDHQTNAADAKVMFTLQDKILASFPNRVNRVDARRPRRRVQRR